MYIQPCFFIFTFIIMFMQLYDQLFLTYNQNLVQLFELNINLNIKLMSKQLANQQSNQVISSTQDIAALLQFQQKLLHLVHSQLYSKPTVDEDDIVKFQINYVSEINEAWKRMIQDLMFRLVKQRIPYDSALRDHFHKVLAVQFLPFLRINKHELTQVSLYGFDIYIQPLSAILQILNRIDGQRHILIKYNSQKKQQSVWNQKPQDIWQCVKKGWNQFIYQTSLFKISLNVYMLKQYLKIGAKSLVKKDKQIVFTGCCNLFTELLHLLKRCKQIWLLCELSQLNTQLYQFHPSFNYSHFYSLMFPIVKQYEPVFNSMRVVGQKCLNANILTPLLLSVLRNRQSFHLFIEQADHQCWIPYLNGIVFGFMYNFKARILEYEEAMQVLIGAILKLGVMDALKIEYFMGQLPKQWNEVREYFISALKIGYNVGQLQTWHPTQFDKIQQRIINCTKDSLLMHSGLPAQVQMNVYFSKGFDWELESCLQQIAGSLLNKQQLTSSFSPKIAQVIEVNNFTIYCILRLSHLIKLCKLTNNIHCICYIISFLNKIGLVDSIVLRRRLSEIGDLFSEVAIKQIEKQQRGRQDLKQVLFLYIKKNKPTTKIFEIIKVCLMISTPKQATSQIISIVQSQHVELQSISNLAEFIASSMIGMYCPQRMSGSIKVKTFEKEYTIEQEVINMNNRLHSCINVLVEAIVQRKSAKSVQVLVWIAKLCNWIVIPLINFPVSTRYDPKQESKKLQSFGIWLITNPQQYPLLFQLLSIGMSITSSQIKIYFTQIALINICDQIILQLNRVLYQLSELQDNMQYRYILKLLQIFVVIYPLSKSALNVQINKKVMKLYLRCVQKLDTIISNTQDDNIIQEVVRSVYEIYCPLIDLIFQTTDSSRKWRKYMRKLCLVSLEINTQKVNNVREFELSSIRKDKGFLIHNPVEFNDKTENLNNNLRLKSRIETLLNESKRYTNKNIFNSKQELYSKPQYLISCLQIRDFQPDPKEKDSGFYSKQYLLPYLSEKTITLLLKSCSQTSVQLLTDLLSMSPSNHNRLVQWGIANNNKDILKTIGISKQAVQIHFPQILNIVPNQQFPALVAHLDYQSKKSISDNFNLVTMKQRIQGTAEQCKQKHLIIDLSQDLAFLLVLNQSNWRYANELINNIGTNKQSGLSNIPSMLLQYLEYIRITSQSNQDYEVKADIFMKIAQAYENMLRQKFQYIQFLENNLNNQFGQVISEEELRLFKVNQLAYIGAFIEAWQIKDFLIRAANLRKQITLLTSQLSKFENILLLIDDILRALLGINITVNQIAKGRTLCPDFLHSYCMASQNAYQINKIALGEYIENYYMALGVNPSQIYRYIPIEPVIPIMEYIKNQIGNFKNIQRLPLLTGEIKNPGELNTKKLIAETYQELEKHLILNKIISTQGQIVQILRVQKQQNQQICVQKWLFYFGFLFRAMELTHQNKCKLDEMTQKARVRQVLSWELVKKIDSETYHHIKSILVDQEIESRKIKFIYNEKLILSQGANLTVTKLNRQKYCSLVAKSTIGEVYLSRVKALMQGVQHVI